jgi:hypothetical protein
MNTTTKIITILVASIVGCLLIVAPFTQAAQQNLSLGDNLTNEAIEECKPAGFRVRPRVRFAVWFLKNAEPVEVEGTVVALADKKLILNTNEDQIRVNLPTEWVVENEVLTLEELYTSYLSEGERVTVKALGADMIDKDGLRIYILIGYKIINDLGVQATANLRINIED